MPTVFSDLAGYRLFFFSLDRGEPVHVHVEKDNKHAKFWLVPIALAKSRNFRSHELVEIRRLIETHIGTIRSKWNEHFSRQN
ncbi:MAG: DUF4160 domain-containing protein [Planctomycetota bacterium]